MLFHNELAFRSAVMTAVKAQCSGPYCITAVNAFCKRRETATGWPLTDVNLEKLNDVVDDVVYDTHYYR